MKWKSYISTICNLLIGLSILFLIVTLLQLLKVKAEPFPLKAQSLISEVTQEYQNVNYAKVLLKASSQKKSLQHMYLDYVDKVINIQECIQEANSIEDKLQHLIAIKALTYPEDSSQINMELKPKWELLTESISSSKSIISEHYIQSIYKNYINYWYGKCYLSSGDYLDRYVIYKQCNTINNETTFAIAHCDPTFFNSNMYLIVNDTLLLDHHHEGGIYEFTPIKKGLDSIQIDIILRDHEYFVLDIQTQTIYYEVE